MTRRLPTAGLLTSLSLACLGCSDLGAAPLPAPPSPVEAVASVAVPAPQVIEAAPVPEVEPGTLAAAAAATSIVISAVGDCTLGGDYRVGRAAGTFQAEMDAVGDDYRYPFSGVLDVLSKDDLTIANLETTLSTATTKIEATFVFSGKPEYAQVLKQGSVEVVNVANNHSYDLGTAGFADTVGALKAHSVGFFGNGHIDRRVIKGVEVVNLGFTGGDSIIRGNVVRSVQDNKRPDNLVIVSFHWGVEGSNYPIDDQKQLGRAAVDAGADLVLGHHPHVLQGIEPYRGKHIVYSLGNFVFGGHSNPVDKDSIIYQETFVSKEGRMELSASTIIPVRISSVTHRNDYRPVILDEGESERVLARIDKYSSGISPPSAKRKLAQ